MKTRNQFASDKPSPEKTFMHTRGKARGFSLVEMMIVMVIMLIATGIGFIALQPALRQIRVTNAYNTTLMTMRRARELAIGQRRTYIVTFSNAAVPNTVNIAPASVTPGGTTATYSLPNDVRFTVIAGLPVTAPDSFGTGVVAIEFDQGVTGASASDKTSIYFNPDGSAQDVNGNTNNGVIYVARPGELYSSNAVTLWGATGRLRGWKLYNAGTAKWKQQ